MHILIVEEDHNLANAMKHAIKCDEPKHTCAVGHSVSDGLRLLSLRRPDIIFLDFCLPDDICTPIIDKARWLYANNLPLIILTSLDPRVENIAKKEKLFAFIQKDHIFDFIQNYFYSNNIDLIKHPS